jgi:hypothetical protein
MAGSPGPMERTRDAIVNVEAADMLLRLAARVPLRRRGWQRDRLAVRAPVVPHDGASDEQDAENSGDGVGEDRPQDLDR